MPKTFDAGAGTSSGYTFYRSFSGPNTVMPPAKGGQPGQPVRGVKFQNIQDGSSNTFLVAEAYEPVIWTKPDELAYSPTGPAPKLGGVFGEGFNVLFCDGSVRFIRKGAMPDKDIQAAITTGGGEIVDFP
jgi:prepilin-type processing-associated H-X9-DG protein